MTVDEGGELIDIKECVACGKDHDDLEADEDDEGQFYVCSGRRIDVEPAPVVESIRVAKCKACGGGHDSIEVKTDGLGRFYACPNGERVDVLAEPQATMGEAALEEHRLRLQALMKEAVAPLLERIDASERRADEVQARLDVLTDRHRSEDLARHETQLVEARKRFRASLAMEAYAFRTVSPTEALKMTDALLDAAGMNEPVPKTSVVRAPPPYDDRQAADVPCVHCANTFRQIALKIAHAIYDTDSPAPPEQVVEHFLAGKGGI